MLRIAAALLLASAHANAVPLYFCIAPPVPCTTLTAVTSMSLYADNGHPHAIINGHDYAIAGASYAKDAVPNSVIVPDAIFAAKFE